MIYLFSFFTVFSQVAFAETNPVLGQWTRGSDASTCKVESITFEAKQIQQFSDADGELIKKTFKKVAYDINGNLVAVDFGERHSFGLSEDRTHVMFKVVSKDQLQLQGRKNRTQILTRCAP